MPTGGCFEIAGELVFPDVASREAWERHELDEADKAPLKRHFYDLAPVSGKVTFTPGKVQLFRDGATVWIVGSDLYAEFNDPDGAASRGPACAVVAARTHGARGIVYFEGLEAKDSFSITISNGACTVAKFKRGDEVQREPAHERAMAALRAHAE